MNIIKKTVFTLMIISSSLTQPVDRQKFTKYAPYLAGILGSAGLGYSLYHKNTHPLFFYGSGALLATALGGSIYKYLTLNKNINTVAHINNISLNTNNNTSLYNTIFKILMNKENRDTNNQIFHDLGIEFTKSNNPNTVPKETLKSAIKTSLISKILTSDSYNRDFLDSLHRGYNKKSNTSEKIKKLQEEYNKAISNLTITIDNQTKEYYDIFKPGNDSYGLNGVYVDMITITIDSPTQTSIE